MKKYIIILCALSVALVETMGNEKMALMEKELSGVEKVNGNYQLSENNFSPNAAGIIIIDAENSGTPSGGKKTEDKSASRGKAVEDLKGSYIINVAQACSYDIWARVKAPWAGHWSFSLQISKTGKEQSAKGGLPAGWTTTFGENNDNILLEGGFPVEKDDAEHFAYVKGPNVKLSPGQYNVHMEIFSAIITDQIIFCPQNVKDPQKQFADKNGLPVADKPEKSSEGTVTFEKAYPNDLKKYNTLNYKIKGPAAGIKWFYSFPLRTDAKWESLNADGNLKELALQGQGLDGLQLKAEFLAGEPEASLMSPALEYEKENLSEIALPTTMGIFKISKVNGYWGDIVSKDEKTFFRKSENPALPFAIGIIAKDSETVKETTDFRVTTIKFDGSGTAWVLNCEYTDQSEKIFIKLTGKCENSEAITWQAFIKNDSDKTISRFMFPVIDGVQIGADYKDDNIAWVGYLRKPAMQVQNWLRSVAGQLTFIDLYDQSGGLYIGVHDKTMLDGIFHMRPYDDKGPYKFTVEKHPLIKPGQKWESQKYVMAVHAGDWHNAADNFYRPWYDSEMPEPENPQWLLKDYSGMVQMTTIQSGPNRLPEASCIAKFLGWNFAKVFLCKWPGPAFDPTRGGFPAVKKNADWVNKNGGQADSYTDIAGCVLWHNSDFMLYQENFSSSLDYFKQPSLDWRLKNQFITLSNIKDAGKVKAIPNSNYWLTQPYTYRMCINTADVEDYWVAVAKHYAKAGLNLYWDEAGNAFGEETCFSPLHQHAIADGGWNFKATAECARKMIKEARKIKPDFIITGENYNDRAMSAINLPYFQDNNEFPFWDEVVRYTHPGHIYSVKIIKNSDFLDRAFLFHARLSSSDIFNGPGITTWFRARVQLVNMAKDISFQGRYRDNVGLELINATNIDARYVVLDKDGRKFIVVNVTNPDGKTGADIKLKNPLNQKIKYAFAYAMEGKAFPVKFKNDAEGNIIFGVSGEVISSIILCAAELKAGQVRVFAQMPMLETYPPKIRATVVNISDATVSGNLKIKNQGPLKFSADNAHVNLAPGAAIVLDFPFTGRDQLKDFHDVEVVLSTSGFKNTAKAIIAPTLANGGFEIDKVDNAQADYWANGLRDFAEPYEGKYCLAIPAKMSTPFEHAGGRAAMGCPFSSVEALVYLLPNTSYEITLVYRSAGDKPVKCDVRGTDEKNQGTFAQCFWLEKSPDFGWKKASMKFKTAEKTYKSYLRLSNMDDSEKGCNIWIDDVKISELNK